MYGLQAISAANGWQISFAGVTIVFTGLIILSTVIACLERALTLWDRKGELLELVGRLLPQREVQTAQPATPSPPFDAQAELSDVGLPPEELEVATYFALITDRLGQPFALMNLLEQAEKRGIHRPHSHLDLFLKLKLLEEHPGEPKGFYLWNKHFTVKGVEQLSSSPAP